MQSGQEGVIAIEEERTMEGGVEVTRKTLVAANEEGVVAFQTREVAINTAEPRPPPPPPAVAWPDHSAAVDSSHPLPIVINDVRKNSWSNRFEDFCCLYDIHSKWYELKGKGCWCVLFLLLLYLIAGILVAVGGILYCVGKIIAALSESSSNEESQPRPPTPAGSSCCCC